MTTILVVEDQSLVRDAIAMLLSLEDELDVIGKCSHGQEAIQMPQMSGLDLAVHVASHHIASHVVLMTTFAKPGYIKRAMSVGVKGFVLKEADSDYLIASIKDVIAGKVVISTELALMALDDNNPLSEKEMSALKLASEGMKTHDIASALFLSEGTVRNYLSEAISKLNATNRIDAARIAQQKGWL
jgi:two-component system response regulator DesR